MTLPQNLLTPIPNNRNRHSKVVGHDQRWKWLGSVANDPSVKVLEIGSRNVSSAASWKKHAPLCNYTGFDLLGGDNVDVVGDAHQLSKYFGDETFDVIISSAVFEHLAIPWVVIEEIAKILKVGGQVCTETHFSFCEHELPWNFFQFHPNGLQYLFNESLGFEIIDAGFSNPLCAWFSSESSEYLKGKRIGNIYCHANLLSRKTRSVLTSKSGPFDWRKTLSGLHKSSYPENTGLSKK